MGVVYKAEDAKLDRPVALKFISPATVNDKETKLRLVREAQAAAALDHPNICPVYGIHDEGGQTFVVLAFIDGPSLADRIAEGPLQLDEALNVAIQIGEGLLEAHQKGVVHRDVKPHNVMLTVKGQARIMDFGLAQLAGRSKITKSGTTLGTPAYMSPEQLQGMQTDHRVDIWALGCVLYEMLTQRTPFEAEYEQAVAYGVINEAPEPLNSSRSDLPPELDDLLDGLLAKSADERLQDMEAVVAQLRSIRRSPAERDSKYLSEVPGGQQGRSRAKPPRGRSSRKRVGSNVVGRNTELNALRDALEQVEQGASLVIGVSGEAGVGKTTVAEAFLAELETSGKAPTIARGQCSERLAGTEAYLPFLDALESLMESDKSLARLVRQRAPWWFVQAGSVAADNPSNARILEEAKSVTQERIKREVASFFRAASESGPVLLFIEDLHWADASSIDLLSYLAAKFDEMRLLILATYRPEEMVVADHPYLQIKPDLLSRGQCQEIRVRYLERSDIENYLALRYPGHHFPAELAELIFGQTEGSPLFMADLVRDMQNRGLIQEDAGVWRLSQPVLSIGLELPSSIEAMIQRKVDVLSADDARLLGVASVQGFVFDSAAIARVSSLDEEGVEERLQHLDSAQRFIQFEEEAEFPDRTPTLKYRFVHVLYQNRLYDSLPRTRRIRLSRALAETLEGLYGQNTAEVASQLGSLFETARDFEKAASYLSVGAGHAAGLFAFREAISLIERGLKLLEELPHSSVRDRLELKFQITLGASLTATRGYGHEEVGAAYTRMHELINALGLEPGTVPATLGLLFYYITSLQLDKASALTDELLGLAEDEGNEALIPIAQGLRGTVEQFLGRFIPAQERLEGSIQSGLRCFGDAGATDAHSDLLVTSWGHLALNTWILGYPEQAKQPSLAAKERAEKLANPFVLTHYFGFAAFLNQSLGEPDRVFELCEHNLTLSEREGYALNVAWASLLKGWALAERGDPHAALELMGPAIKMWRGAGMKAMVPLWHSLIADIHGLVGEPEQGLLLLEESLALVAKTKHRLYESELHRVKGNLLLVQQSSATDVEASYQKAIDVAREQQARSYELRAAVALARLWKGHGRSSDAGELLSAVHGWFTEGLESRDLLDAKALLGEITGP